ncbi:hypothetical protein K458DRAFT_423002 [Lentithecium fluviatile CBS 122367]|uniref:DUF7730 domain-containing protein n=1 Tax=Lentithecium fluviatile CBS 122367 TaxID=1168545 RepID=A0A6G1IK71_9PLEO|nr:hypothetical protein K458DRAFT_423002 [Lentithecium fluviatile CBS 122367]
MAARRHHHAAMSAVHFEHRGRKINRRNSLSVGKPVKVWARLFRKKTSSQSESPLFSKLPPELRFAIFELALVDTGAVHMHMGYTHRSGWTLYEDSRFMRIQAMSCDLNVETPLQLEKEDHALLNDYSSTTLLRTCRLIYTEALPILYSNNQFVFGHVNMFTTFTRNIPKSHLQYLRSIRFFQVRHPLKRYQNNNKLMGNWTEIIGTLNNLKSIHLVFEPRWDANTLEQAQESIDMLRSATSTQCRVHVYELKQGILVSQRVEQGTRKPGSASAHQGVTDGSHIRQTTPKPGPVYSRRPSPRKSISP